MKNNNYYQKRDLQNRLKMAKYTERLPEFCLDFFIGIENNTSSLTRYNYSMDLFIFFKFISDFVFHKNIEEITLDDINSIKTRHIEQYLSSLSYYELDGKEYKNDERGKARKLASLRSFFKYLFNHDLIKSNVASKIETPKLHNKEIIRLEREEVSRLMNVVENPTDFTKRQQIYKKNTFELDKKKIKILKIFSSMIKLFRKEK